MPDYEMLKALVLNSAQEANLNIFDKVYDWNLILT